LGRRSIVKVLVLLAALSLVAAACGKKTQTPSSTGHKGGAITVGAEQWPDCVNPITSCASAYWTTLQIWNVLPRLVDYDNKGNAKAGPMAVELPSTANGDLVGSPFTLKWKINPKAVWSDGKPITSKDVDFTWKAIMHTKGAYSTVGYDSIKSIDTTDPAVAVINFSKPYADWTDLFGGNQFGVLEAAAFPTADAAKPDLSKEMNNLISFSGGPWQMQSFAKTATVFVRNAKFWGHQPLLDKMTWVPKTDQQTEIAGVLSGETQVSFPQPSNVSIAKQLAKSNPNAKAVGGRGVFYEALWLNLEDPVLKQDAVREALFYAVDRQQIVNGLIHLNDPAGQILNCGPFALTGGPWCHVTPWDKYSYKPAKSLSLLKNAGWSCSGVPAKPCSKGGQTLKLAYRFCNGNARRGTTFDLVKAGVKPAGFDFNQVTKGSDCGSPLFTDTLPKGNYQIADYAQGPIAYDPTPTGNLACDQIPKASNSYGGGNYSRWCDAKSTTLMKQADAEPDTAKRLALIDQLYTRMEAQHVLLPIYILPNVTIWRSDKVGGPVGDENTNPLGTFQNADQWYLK
jgi:peptide/nickel transport system substrate-binding protein